MQNLISRNIINLKSQITTDNQKNSLSIPIIKTEKSGEISNHFQEKSNNRSIEIMLGEKILETIIVNQSNINRTICDLAKKYGILIKE